MISDRTPARRSWTGWLIAAPVFTVCVKLALDTLDSGVVGWLLPILAVPACVLVSIPLHECGHLLAALSLRLRIIQTRIRYAEPAYVRVTADAGSPLLPLRFVLFHLAGPAVNVLLAAVLLHLGTKEVPLRECALVAAFTTALIGLSSLVPQKLGTLHSDGAHVLRWILNPSQARAAEEYTIYLRLLRTLGLPVDGSHVPVTAEHVTIGPAAIADFVELHAYVLAPRAKPQLFALIAPTLGVIAGVGQLHRTVVTGRPADPEMLARITAVATALAERQPRDRWHLVVRAIVELLGDRPGEARRLLLGITPSAEPDATDALMIRAVAETMLGDTAQAARVLTALRAAHDQAGTPERGEVPPVLAEILTARYAKIPG